MSASAFLPSLATGLIQWWAWCGGLAVLLAVAVKAAGPRRPAVHDLLCRALVAFELLLLPASLAIAFQGLPAARPAVVPKEGLRPAASSGPALTPAPSSRVVDGPVVAASPASHPHPQAVVDGAPARPAAAFGVELGLPAWAAGSLLLAYLAGLVIGFGRLAQRLRRSLELASTCGAPPPEELLEPLRAVERRMRVRRPVRLVLTEEEVAFHDAIIAEGEGTILGMTPNEREETLHGPLERTWVWVKCQVTGQ